MQILGIYESMPFTCHQMTLTYLLLLVEILTKMTTDLSLQLCCLNLHLFCLLNNQLHLLLAKLNKWLHKQQDRKCWTKTLVRTMLNFFREQRISQTKKRKIFLRLGKLLFWDITKLDIKSIDESIKRGETSKELMFFKGGR